MSFYFYFFFFFLFKQKTAYEILRSDWSSDVCSSDPSRRRHTRTPVTPENLVCRLLLEIGRASCRERVCQYVYISVDAVSLKKKKKYIFISCSSRKSFLIKWPVKQIKKIKNFFFFKQKTAYEILRSDWSSDVCSSDLMIRRPQRFSGVTGVQTCALPIYH